MIKIYFKNRLISLSKKPVNKDNTILKSIHEIDDLNIEINRFLFNDSVRRLHIYDKKSSKQIKLFEERIPLINAGGGLVYNNQQKIILIYRRKHWDLPKGKQDYGENIETTALREVSEECGLSLDYLKITDNIGYSYHIYQEFSDVILKKTAWFVMHYSGNELPVPQKSEGIVKAEWFKPDDLYLPLSKTYPSVKYLLRKANFSEIVKEGKFIDK